MSPPVNRLPHQSASKDGCTLEAWPITVLWEWVLLFVLALVVGSLEEPSSRQSLRSPCLLESTVSH